MGNLQKVIVENVQQQKGLEENKVNQIKNLYLPMIELLDSMEEEFNILVNQPITLSLTKQAKDLRLRIRKVRTVADDKRKEAKDQYMIAANAIQGAYNTLKFAVVSKEEKLQGIEKFYEIQEQKRLERLQIERSEEIKKYGVEFIPDSLGLMADEVWKNYLQGTIDSFKKAEAEKQRIKEESERKEKLEQLKRQRMQEIMPYFDYFEQIEDSEGNQLEIENIPLKAFKKRLEEAKKKKSENDLKMELKEERTNEFKPFFNFAEPFTDADGHEVSIEDLKPSVYKKHLASAKKAKNEYEKEQKLIKIENEKLKAQQEKKEKEAKIAAEKAKQKAEKTKARSNELQPYLIFIRDLNKMLEMSEADYANELSGIKKAKKQHDKDQELIKKAEEAKAAKEKQRLAEEAEKLKAPDKNKVQQLIKDLENFELPEMSTDVGKKIVKNTDGLIGKITAWLEVQHGKM